MDEMGIRRILIFSGTLIVLAIVVNAAAWALNWYGRLTWFDEVDHLSSALAVVSAIVYPMRLKVIGESGFRGVDMPVGPWIVIAALSGLFLGIVWEVLEALFLNLSWVDTLSDLVLDMVGAALGGWLAATLAK
jgi:hypothetical protein